MKKELLQSIKVIALGLILAFGINFAIAWTGPTAAPTGSNVEGPITVGDNIGGKNQVKLGGVNFGKTVSIGKVTDTTGKNVVLDVNGFSYTKGIANLGLVSVYPSGFSQGPDGQLFEVFGTDFDFNPDSAVFAVDTSNGGVANARNLYVGQKSLFEDKATFNNDVYVQKDTNVQGRISVGTLGGTYAGSNNEYNLNVKGTTNIGRNTNFCVLSRNDVENRQRICPDGLYLAGMDTTADESKKEKYATCRPFDPAYTFTNGYDPKDGSVFTCYSKPGLLANWRVAGSLGTVFDGSTVYTGSQAAKCVKEFNYNIEITGGEFASISNVTGTVPVHKYSNGTSGTTISWWFASGSDASNNWHENTSCRNQDYCYSSKTTSDSIKNQGYMQRARVIVTDSNSLQSVVENALWISKDRKCV